MRRRTSPLSWAVADALAVALLVAAAAAAAALPPAPLDGSGRELAPAFLGFLIAIGTAIWQGLQVAAKVTLAALSWSVKALWLFATTTFNGLKALGVLVAKGVTEVWQFFEATYEHVIKPAWVKFWRLFDKARAWLESTFGPVLEFLRDVRDHIIAFWKTYVRPWLDLIDVARRMLRVLGSLGLGWARALDAKLGEIADAIEAPFRALLAKINEVINVVNRIADVNGLLQRVALIRSMERDARYFARALHNWRRAPLTDADKQKTRTALTRRSQAQIEAEFSALVARGEGPLAGLAAEMAVIWRKNLTGR